MTGLSVMSLSTVTNDVDTLSNALQQTLQRVFSAVLTFILCYYYDASHQSADDSHRTDYYSLFHC